MLPFEHESSRPLRGGTIGLLLILAFVATACNGASGTPGGGADDAGAPGDASGAKMDASAPANDGSAPPQDATLDAPSDAGADQSAIDASADASNTGLTDGGVADSGPADSGVSPSNWMGSVPGSTSLADLSIPGTHDTGATIDMPGTLGTTRCQDLSIAEQLAVGVRYLDIRVNNIDNAFEVYHLTVDQQLTFASVLATISSFLAANPSETLVMSLKQEGSLSTGSTNSFEQTFDSYLNADGGAGLWYLGDAIPTLDQARGKIVLLRRFTATNLPAGIDATAWNSASTNTFTIANGNATLRIQDYYDVSVAANDPAKWAAITELFGEALTGDAGAGVLYLNNASGYLDADGGLEDILGVSNVINPELVTYFTGAVAGRYGIVGMDFVDAVKAGLVLSANFQ